MGEYSQVSGDTLDFGLVGIDEYAQPSGSTVDFELIEATTVQLSESFSVNDVTDLESSFYRFYSERFTLNDADVKEIGKVLDEVFSLNEFSAKQVEKPVSESFTVDDVYSREASYEKGLNEVLTVDEFEEITAVLNLFETVSLNDADVRRLEKFLAESFSGDENFSRDADYFRSQAEALGLNDAVEAIVIEFLNAAETLGLNDVTTQTAIIQLFEDLTVDESFSREASYFRNYSGVLGVNEFESFSLARTVDENFSTDAFTSITAIVNLFEDLTVDGTDTYAIGKVLDEAFSVDDSIVSRDVSIVRTEVFRIDDADIRQVQRTLAEAFGGDDAYSREAAFLRDYSEDMVLDDRDVRFTVGKALDEVFSVDETRSFKIGKAVSEDVGVNDVYSREADLFRDYSEVFGLESDFDVEQDLFRSYEADISFDDTSTFSIGKVLDENLVLEDVYSRDADLFRDFSEVFSLNDVERFTVGKNLDESLNLEDFAAAEIQVFRIIEESFGVNDNIKKKLSRQLNEAISLDDEFDFFFSEGPGTPPYFVRNSFVQGNSVQNEYVTKTLQNLFESLNVDNSFGDREQT